ncbi:MAG: DUF4956 domain-containing protein [Bryobacterales bacterium]|nr:DUF4956 domain-containing protein [Bryobacterales bacterium]
MMDINPGTLADLRVTLTVLLSAFAMSHLLALVYVWTHRGLSYSQSFVQTLVMSSVVTAMMMLTIGNNLVWGIGMMGAMALVRFRTNLRDPRDMVFVFAALVSGIAAGTRAFGLGALGVAAFSLVAFYLAFVPFGARKSFDGLLRYTAPWQDGVNESATALMQRHCRQFVLATVREVRQGEASEHVYHVRFRKEESRGLLAKELAAVKGLSGVSILLEDTRVEL